MFSLYEYDYEGHMNLIREEGREEGREKGREEGRVEKESEIISNMLKNNYSPETISKLTGCSLEAIKKIQNTHEALK